MISISLSTFQMFSFVYKYLPKSIRWSISSRPHLPAPDVIGMKNWDSTVASALPQYITSCQTTTPQHQTKPPPHHCYLSKYILTLNLNHFQMFSRASKQASQQVKFLTRHVNVKSGEIFSNFFVQRGRFQNVHLPPLGCLLIRFQIS